MRELAIMIRSGTVYWWLWTSGVIGRTRQSVDELQASLTPKQKQAVDLREQFIQIIQKQAPGAEMVHERFHISSYLGDADQDEWMPWRQSGGLPAA